MHVGLAVADPLNQSLEVCPCPLCGADKPEPTPYAASPYRVVRCTECSLWYLSPRLEEGAIAQTYAEDTYFGGDGGAAGYADYADQEGSLRQTFRRLLGRLDANGLCGGRLLEIGCGYGYFLDEARPYFDQRVGTELSLGAARHAKNCADEIVVGGVEALPDESLFDCIAALHVIEHVYRPTDFVRKAARHLKPGGVMVLAAPDMGSFWRIFMGRRWPSFKFPEHIAFYDRRTLPALMRDAALCEPQPIPYVHDFPLTEILRKLGMASPDFAKQISVPLPATTICFAARLPERGL